MVAIGGTGGGLVARGEGPERVGLARLGLVLVAWTRRGSGGGREEEIGSRAGAGERAPVRHQPPRQGRFTSFSR